MTIDIEIVAKLLSPVIALVVGAIIKHYTEAKSKVVSFIGHVSTFQLQGQQKTSVFTHSVIVRNVGRQPAKNVRLGHYTLPPDIRIEPSVQYTIERNPEGAAEIVIPVLVPKEQVTISYLYFPPLTWGQINSYTKSDDGFAKIIKVIPMPQPSRLIVGLIWVLTFVGASFLVYWLVRLAAYTL